MSEKKKVNKRILAGLIGLAMLIIFLGTLYVGFRSHGEMGSKEIGGNNHTQGSV